MNALLQAQQAYGATKTATRTGRETELQLLQSVTGQLVRSAANLPASFPQLATALHQNRKIWTHLAISVADKDNALPADLRARIFYLGEFVWAHSRKVLRKEADITALVDINTAVIRGLSAAGLR